MTRTKNVAHKSAHKNAVLNHGQEKLLNTQEAAEYLSVSSKTIIRLVKSGQLKAHRIGRGGRMRFRQADIDGALIPESSAGHDRDLDSFINNQTSKGAEL
jgi:excisionase family DNA binding protein